jgi:hypothetical protein
MKNRLTIDRDVHVIKQYSTGKRWYLNGLLHREDGPAIEWLSGTKEWFINGNLHREDGPAIEYTDGYKVWYLNDRLVYSNKVNYLYKYHDLTESFKKSIIKHMLTV